MSAVTPPPTVARTSSSSDAQAQVAEAVTALFVPGDRPERYAKAVASGAGVVIIDLEDAVAPEAKENALASVLAALGPERAGDVTALVRVNPVDTPTHSAEVTALLELAGQDQHGLLGIVVPKAEDPRELRKLGHWLSGLGLALVPLVESASGVVHALEIAQVPGVTRLAFGAVDYALDIDADVDAQGGARVLDYPRSVLVVASRAAGIAAPLDSPAIEIKDVETVAASARLARAFGFGGKLCIHPHQLATVHDAFAPTEEQVQWAQSVAGVQAGAAQVNGQMIDRPVIERAQRILARAGRNAS